MIVYPLDNYDSFLSVEDADTYFVSRLGSSEYISSSIPETALVTAFRSISELDVTIDPTDAVQLQAIKDAQCEQALHELKNDLDSAGFGYLSIPGIQITQKKAPRYSERALAILRPYMTARTVSMVR